MKAWFETLISKWTKTDDAASLSQCGDTPSVRDSVKRLNESRLRQLSEGWIPDRDVPRQGQLIKHWTIGDGKYEAPLPTISSDSWSRLEDFLASRQPSSKSNQKSGKNSSSTNTLTS